MWAGSLNIGKCWGELNYEYEVTVDGIKNHTTNMAQLQLHSDGKRAPTMPIKCSNIESIDAHNLADGTYHMGRPNFGIDVPLRVGATLKESLYEDDGVSHWKATVIG